MNNWYADRYIEGDIIDQLDMIIEVKLRFLTDIISEYVTLYLYVTTIKAM